MFGISKGGFNSAQASSSLFNVLQADLAFNSSTVLEASTVHVLFSTQMWPENQISRVLGEVEHQETLFFMLYLKKSEF